MFQAKKTRNHKTLRLVSWLSLALVALSGCATEATNTTTSVAGKAALFDHVSSALTTASVMAIKGTYGAGCTSRTGNWAIALNGYAFVAGETQLTVVTADVGCTLSVTEVKAGAVLTPVVYRPATPMLLTASYATNGVAFMVNGLGATEFYANFQIQPDFAFNSDFIVQMVYSDNISETDLALGSSFVVTMATATAGVVPAPNATLSLAGFTVSVDANRILKSTSGSIVLTQGSVVAEFYSVDFDTMGPTPSYAVVDAAYNTPAKSRDPLSGASQTIETADFNLIGLNLTTPKKRILIVANIVNGVNSYQLFQITISKPTN